MRVFFLILFTAFFALGRGPGQSGGGNHYEADFVLRARFLTTALSRIITAEQLAKVRQKLDVVRVECAPNSLRPVLDATKKRAHYTAGIELIYLNCDQYLDGFNEPQANVAVMSEYLAASRVFVSNDQLAKQLSSEKVTFHANCDLAEGVQADFKMRALMLHKVLSESPSQKLLSLSQLQQFYEAVGNVQLVCAPDSVKSGYFEILKKLVFYDDESRVIYLDCDKGLKGLSLEVANVVTMHEYMRAIGLEKSNYTYSSQLPFVVSSTLEICRR